MFMDTGSDLLDSAIDYHGLELVDALQRSKTQSFLGSGSFLFAGDPENDLRKKVHHFIAKQTRHLFHEKPAPSKLNYIRDDALEDDLFAAMPPLETFMGINAEYRRQHFNEYLEKGDVIIGRVTRCKPGQGFFITFLCLDCGKKREIADLNIRGFCPQNCIPLTRDGVGVLDIFADDYIRAVVIDLGDKNEGDIITISMLPSDLPETINTLMGPIERDDLPAYYRMIGIAATKNYDTFLKQIATSSNPSCVKNLLKKFDVTDAKPFTFIRSMKTMTIHKGEYAEDLRKTQSHRWSLKSVKQGVDHFKASKFTEAMQHFNRALDIDADNAEALVARGALFANNNNYVKAIEDFEKALTINPHHINAKNYICQTLVAHGKNLQEKRDYDDALIQYQKALDINANYRDAENCMRELDFVRGKKQGDVNDAVEMLLSDSKRKAEEQKKRTDRPLPLERSAPRSPTRQDVFGASSTRAASPDDFEKAMGEDEELKMAEAFIDQHNVFKDYPELKNLATDALLRILPRIYATAWSKFTEEYKSKQIVEHKLAAERLKMEELKKREEEQRRADGARGDRRERYDDKKRDDDRDRYERMDSIDRELYYSDEPKKASPDKRRVPDEDFRASRGRHNEEELYSGMMDRPLNLDRGRSHELADSRMNRERPSEDPYVKPNCSRSPVYDDGKYSSRDRYESSRDSTRNLLKEKSESSREYKRIESRDYNGESSREKNSGRDVAKDDYWSRDRSKDSEPTNGSNLREKTRDRRLSSPAKDEAARSYRRSKSRSRSHSRDRSLEKRPRSISRDRSVNSKHERELKDKDHRRYKDSNFKFGDKKDEHGSDDSNYKDGRYKMADPYTAIVKPEDRSDYKDDRYKSAHRSHHESEDRYRSDHRAEEKSSDPYRAEHLKSRDDPYKKTDDPYRTEHLKSRDDPLKKTDDPYRTEHPKSRVDPFRKSDDPYRTEHLKSRDDSYKKSDDPYRTEHLKSRDEPYKKSDDPYRTEHLKSHDDPYKKSDDPYRTEHLKSRDDPYKKSDDPYKMSDVRYIMEDPYKKSDDRYNSDDPYKKFNDPYKKLDDRYKLSESPYQKLDERYETEHRSGDSYQRDDAYKSEQIYKSETKPDDRYQKRVYRSSERSRSRDRYPKDSLEHASRSRSRSKSNERRYEHTKDPYYDPREIRRIGIASSKEMVSPELVERRRSRSRSRDRRSSRGRSREQRRSQSRSHERNISSHGYHHSRDRSGSRERRSRSRSHERHSSRHDGTSRRTPTKQQVKMDYKTFTTSGVSMIPLPGTGMLKQEEEKRSKRLIGESMSFLKSLTSSPPKKETPSKKTLYSDWVEESSDDEENPKAKRTISVKKGTKSSALYEKDVKLDTSLDRYKEDKHRDSRSSYNRSDPRSRSKDSKDTKSENKSEHGSKSKWDSPDRGKSRWDSPERKLGKRRRFQEDSAKIIPTSLPTTHKIELFDDKPVEGPKPLDWNPLPPTAKKHEVKPDPQPEQKPKPEAPPSMFLPRQFNKPQIGPRTRPIITMAVKSIKQVQKAKMNTKPNQNKSIAGMFNVQAAPDVSGPSSIGSDSLAQMEQFLTDLKQKKGTSDLKNPGKNI